MDVFQNKMDEHFKFNAPQFFDFASQLDVEDAGKAEAYFDTDHEHAQKVLEVAVAVLGPSPRPPKRSLSMSSLPTNNPEKKFLAVDDLSEDLQNLKMTSGHKSERPSRLVRCSSRDNLCKLAQPKAITSKFVSMSEQINKFYNKTPDRFHSKSKDNLHVNETHCKQLLTCTVPQSPNLATKKRIRPLLFPSKKELEDKEVEEVKKYKIKANPINPRVLQQPVKPVHVNKIPNTVIQPFNLTDNHPKPVAKDVPQSVFEFHANPVPKSMYKTSKMIAKLNSTALSIAPRPSCRFGSMQKQQKLESAVKKDVDVKPFKRTKTQQVPFSFDKRDQQIIKKREDQINKVLEEEKKAREFHAKPPPKYLTAIKSPSGSIKSGDDYNNVSSIFKAQPPTVLFKKPFEPKRGLLPLTEITEFQLNSERRAKERQDFDHKLKEKEELLDGLKRNEQQKKDQLQKELAAETRKQMEIKANPIRRYKEVKIVPSIKVTVPVSPPLRTARPRNKENLDYADE